MRLLALSIAVCLLAASAAADQPAPASPLFSRHVVAAFSRAGCNGGTCHGAVQGQNGFRLSLFGAKAEQDYDSIVRGQDGRRIDRMNPERSLLLLKATGQVLHGGGRRIEPGSTEHDILRNWLVAGAPSDATAASRVATLTTSPPTHAGRTGESYQLRVQAAFADGSTEDVTALCTFSSLDEGVAAVDAAGRVETTGVGDTALIVRFRAEPAMSLVTVAREASGSFPEVVEHNFIDGHVLAKLRQLNVPPSPLADDATFLRRVRLDATGQMPAPDEVQAFLNDAEPHKRERKIEQLLNEPGYAAVWTLKFCDLWVANDFGVYADGLAEHFEAPRFHAWVRARLLENTPYDELAARVLTATSREGRSLDEWSAEVVALQEGYKSPREDLTLYSKRKTLDAYWQRKEAIGIPGTLQIAHAFLGLRLECAQCHRHPHDVWQQDDLLSFANFFMNVRRVGFQGDNEKRYPEEANLFKQFEAEGKQLAEEVKQLKEGPGKELAEKAKAAQQEINRLKNEIRNEKDEAVADAKRKQLADHEQTVAENDKLQREIREKEQRGRLLGDDVAKRVLHAQIMHDPRDGKLQHATVTSPLGSQESKAFRLLGESSAMEIAAGSDPREQAAQWLRRPDNPYFAKAIVNRVWAHYFGRGIIDPPDDLSWYNPPTHPALLDDLCHRFIASGYDLKWLHRTILTSRTYQQVSLPRAENAADRKNYAFFYLRRLPAEVLVDALNQATGTREDFDMQYYHWPREMRTVDLPYMPRNGFVTFMLEQFGRPPRNSSVQCDCARQTDASILQVLSLANHPRVWQKIAEPTGRVAQVVQQTADADERVRLLYLSTLSRLPDEAELKTCREHLAAAESPDKGLQAVLWSLLNTREFLLQH